MSAAHAEHVEHGCLGLEDSAAADGADFDGGHGDGDLKVSFQAGVVVSECSLQDKMGSRDRLTFS